MRLRIPKLTSPSPAGQAATEYLILVGMVLMVFAGTAALFSKQVQNYLGLLFELIDLPF
jgi:hypothetical protein